MSDLSPLSGEERKSSFGAFRSVDGLISDFDPRLISLALKSRAGCAISLRELRLYRARLPSLQPGSLTNPNTPEGRGYRYHVVRGGLMSFGPNITDLHRQSASYVDRILK